MVAKKSVPRLVLPAPSGREIQLRFASSGVILSKPEHEPRDRFEQILWASPSLARVVEKARELAEVDLPALLLGETGVGKEVFAEAIHKSGRRSTRSFYSPQLRRHAERNFGQRTLRLR